MVKGIHHVSLKCGTAEEFAQAERFYCEVLGLSMKRRWAEGIMLDTGCGLIEIFSNGTGVRETGAVRHFALLTDDVDVLAAKVKQAGYEVFIEPDDRTLPSDPPYRLRMAFCKGPLGEEIELFTEL